MAYDRVVENVSGILESPENFCNQESGNPGSRTLGGRKLKEEPANRDSHGKTTILNGRTESCSRDLHSSRRVVVCAVIIMQEVLHDLAADGAQKEPKKRVKRRTSSAGEQLINSLLT